MFNTGTSMNNQIPVPGPPRRRVPPTPPPLPSSPLTPRSASPLTPHVAPPPGRPPSPPAPPAAAPPPSVRQPAVLPSHAAPIPDVQPTRVYVRNQPRPRTAQTAPSVATAVAPATVATLSTPANQQTANTGLLNNLFRQFTLLVRACHPVQVAAASFAILILAILNDRGAGGAIIAMLGVGLTQALLGLVNDAHDAEWDAHADREHKPIAEGLLPSSNATFIAAIVMLISLPVAALNGIVAGGVLMLTVAVGYLHNQFLLRTPWSFLSWALTFGGMTAYLSYGGWGGGLHGGAPSWQVVLASAALGIGVHFATSLRDLARDHASGSTGLPLLIARRTGATRLLIATGIFCTGTFAATVWSTLQFGLQQR